LIQSRDAPLGHAGRRLRGRGKNPSLFFGILGGVALALWASGRRQQGR
jgi:hypothetical protein